MIDIQVRSKDRFVVEFKIGYVVDRKRARNDFVVNTWMFVPDWLGINAMTYTKKQFYRDVNSVIRLMTPVYSLQELAEGDALPFRFLEVAFREFASTEEQAALKEVEYQVKMFCSIVKSALRRGVDRIREEASPEEREGLAVEYGLCVRKILRRYRLLGELLPKAETAREARQFHAFGDESLSNRVEYQSFRLLDALRGEDAACFQAVKADVLGLVQEELAWRRSRGWVVAEKDSPDRNRAVVFRFRMLRLFTQTHLFLDANRKKDGQMAEQLSFSVAAGISMVFATIISFVFQQKFGNFTTPLFVALVISYMLKDRIKELTRYYFVHRLAKKYYDNKTEVSMKGNVVGWIKEGVDFITDDHVPAEVAGMRGRSDLLEANNRHWSERIILYRNLVRIDGKALDGNVQYDVRGIHDILYFNVSSFLLKMEDADVPLSLPVGEEGYETIYGERVYYIHFMFQLKSGDDVDYKHFRLILSREGIVGVEKL